jgi:hypothetical protein
MKTHMNREHCCQNADASECNMKHSEQLNIYTATTLT